jgi:hypothetical protein
MSLAVKLMSCCLLIYPLGEGVFNWVTPNPLDELHFQGSIVTGTAKV